MKKKRFPVWATTIYYAQGLPFSLVRSVSVIFFKDLGVSLQSLGLVSLYGLPWTLKFLWSPFVDTRGTKKWWIIIAQAVLAFLCLCTAIVSHAGGDAHHAALIAAVIFFMMAVAAATQDIAIDGFYLEQLDKRDQARFSGWVVASYRLALITGGGLLVALAGKRSWTWAFITAACLFLALMFFHMFALPERRSSGVEADADGKIQPNFWEGFHSFLQLRGLKGALSFIFLFKVGDALLFGMSAPFLLDQGLSKAQYGFFNGVFGILASIGASIFGGWFISRFTLSRGLWLFGFVQNLAIPIYAIISLAHVHTPWILGVCIVMEQASAGVGASAYSNFLMRQNDPRYKATHFAIVTGFMALTTMCAGAASGFLAQHLGYGLFFVVAFLLSLPGLCLVPWISRRPECQV